MSALSVEELKTEFNHFQDQLGKEIEEKLSKHITAVNDALRTVMKENRFHLVIGFKEPSRDDDIYFDDLTPVDINNIVVLSYRKGFNYHILENCHQIKLIWSFK